MALFIFPFFFSFFFTAALHESSGCEPVITHRRKRSRHFLFGFVFVFICRFKDSSQFSFSLPNFPTRASSITIRSESLFHSPPHPTPPHHRLAFAEGLGRGRGARPRKPTPPPPPQTEATATTTAHRKTRDLYDTFPTLAAWVKGNGVVSLA